MTFKTLSFFLGTVALSAAMLLGAWTPSLMESSKPAGPVTTPAIDLTATAPGGTGDSGEGGVSSALRNLLSLSPLAVNGTVIAEANASGDSVIVTIQVRSVLIGQASSRVRVIRSGQIGDNHLLQSGERCLLFLRPAEGPLPDVYQIAGAHEEGVFILQNGEWVNEDTSLTAAMKRLSRSDSDSTIQPDNSDTHAAKVVYRTAASV